MVEGDGWAREGEGFDAVSPEVFFTLFETGGLTDVAPRITLSHWHDKALEDIKKTYKKLSLIYHPDKAADPTDHDVQSRYINLVKAYETLTGK